MATHKGKAGAITAGAVPTAVGEVRSFEVNVTANLTSASRMGDDWTRDESTQNSWTATIEAFWDKADAGQALFVVGARITVNLYPEGATTGLTELTGTATVESAVTKQSHDTLVEKSITLKGYGALVEGVL